MDLLRTKIGSLNSFYNKFINRLLKLNKTKKEQNFLDSIASIAQQRIVAVPHLNVISIDIFEILSKFKCFFFGKFLNLKRKKLKE